MSEFPANMVRTQNTISTCGLNCLVGQTSMSSALVTMATGTWPAANRALYIPVEVDQPAIAVKMIFQVTTQSGNYDIGIYSETGSRLVSTGSTAVPAAGIAVADITDTTLTPGTYFLALNIDNTTAAVQRLNNPPSGILQCCGMQQQAVGAVTLPSTATFANPASTYWPSIAASLVTTV